jgi:hypothetical protein
MLDLMFVPNVWDIICPVFHLFIISVRDLDGIIIGMLDGLVISESLLDWDLISNCSLMIISVGPVVGDLFVGDLWLVVGVVLLDRDVLDVGVRLGGLVQGGGREALRLRER